MTRQPLVRDRRQAQLMGVVFVCVGSYLLYDAYEARGRQRPFVARLLPS